MGGPFCIYREVCYEKTYHIFSKKETWFKET